MSTTVTIQRDFDIKDYPVKHREDQAYLKTYYDIVDSEENSISLMSVFINEFSKFNYIYQIKEYLRLEDDEYRRNKGNLYVLYMNGSGLYYSPQLIKICKLYLENHYGEKRFKSILNTIKNDIWYFMRLQQRRLAAV